MCYIHYMSSRSGVDLSSFAQQIFGLSTKQLTKIDLSSDMNNVQLLEQAQITRELTRIRYANFTAKYKKDAKSRTSGAIIRKTYCEPYNSSATSTSAVASCPTSSAKRLLSGTLKMSIKESNMKTKINKK